MSRFGRWIRPALAAGLIVALGAGLGTASGQGANSTVRACYLKKARKGLPKGSIRIISASRKVKCRAWETEVKLGRNGPAGSTGPAGKNGNNGSNGVNGKDGATGATGPAGSSVASGATGAIGPTGPIGATGPKGTTGAAGPTGPKGTDGATGPVGPSGATGPSGGSLTLVDANNVTLGKVVSAPGGGVGGPEFQQVSILTSTGHLVTLQWDGTFAPAQIYYTVANCTGSAYLNDGGSPGQKIYGKSVAYSGSLNTLMAPTTVANGTSTSVSFTSAAIDNPTCGPSAGQNSGWALSAVTHAAVGLPATISAPLHFG